MRNFIQYYASPLSGGRAILMMDVVINDEVVNDLSQAIGSPAPINSVRSHEGTIDLDQVIERMAEKAWPNGEGPQARVLAAIVEYGEPALTSTIMDKTGMDRTSVTRAVEKLEEDGTIRETTGQKKFRKWVPA